MILSFHWRRRRRRKTEKKTVGEWGEKERKREREWDGEWDFPLGGKGRLFAKKKTSILWRRKAPFFLSLFLFIGGQKAFPLLLYRTFTIFLYAEYSPPRLIRIIATLGSGLHLYGMQNSGYGGQTLHKLTIAAGNLLKKSNHPIFHEVIYSGWYCYSCETATLDFCKVAGRFKRRTVRINSYRRMTCLRWWEKSQIKQVQSPYISWPYLLGLLLLFMRNSIFRLFQGGWSV